MPIIDFYCNDCGNQLEAIREMHDESDFICPVCKAVMVREWRVGHGGFYMNRDGTRKGHKGTRGVNTDG